MPTDFQDAGEAAYFWPDALDGAVTECVRVILAGAASNWAAPAGRLEWDCRTTVVHLASDFVGYAGQLTAPRTRGYVPFDVILDGEPTAEGLAEVVLATGGLLSSVCRTTDTDVVSWHPFGMAGPVDFCAMGVVEALVHTHDLSEGLDVSWQAPDSLADRVLRHLFPLVARADSAWRTLLVATGRVPDEIGVFATSWRWQNTGS